MPKNALFISLFLIVLIALAACGGTPQPAEPTAIALPQVTKSAAPAAASTLPATPSTAAPALVLDAPKEVLEGGFSFRPPSGYQVDLRGPQVGIFDPDHNLIISFMGATSNPQKQTANEILDEFLAKVFLKANGNYIRDDQVILKVDGVPGVLVEVSGNLSGLEVQGSAMIVMPDTNRYLFGLGLAKTGQNPKLWEEQGSKVFKSIIDSIKFLAPSQSNLSGQKCTISVDKTYGYTKENPMKVGGEAFEGPARERTYLDNIQPDKTVI
jgi:hypothetical protein